MKDHILNCAAYLRSYTSESRSHKHNYYQWVLPLVGNLELEIEHQSDTVSDKKAAFIPVDEKHAFAGSHENLFLILDVGVNVPWINQLSMPAFWEMDFAIHKYLQFANCYLENEKDNLTANLLVGDFLAKLLVEKYLNKNDEIITKAKNWIDLHFSEVIDVKKLSNHCCLSKSQLQRRFKKLLGCGIVEYWRTKRLEQAKLLLNNINMNIDEIAYSIGYESSAAFSRAFTKQWNIPPKLWRKMLLSANKMTLEDKTST